MDEVSESTPVLHPSPAIRSRSGGLAVSHIDLPMVCVLCQTNEAVDLEASICGDCKFLFFDDFGSPVEDTQPRRTTRTRRTRHDSAESIEMLFSQRLSHMINIARQNQPTGSDQENQIAETDTSARLLRRIRARTTPNGSRRFRRVISDTESDGVESLYAESESNVSFNGQRLFQYESDTISYSAYGGDSDASVDGPSFFDTETINRQDGGSDTDIDTDIDPMRAGLDLWSFDDQDDDVGELNEWDEPYPFQDVVHPSGPLTRRRQLDSPEHNGAVRLRRVRRPTYYVISDLDETEARLFSFDEPRGAPPAAVSCVSSLPRVVINEDEHGKADTLVCAICKDFLSVGTVVNQLPCSHLYHSSCILPWLHARNTCPLCRYELPTDDREYEERKRNAEIRQPQQPRAESDDSSSESNDDDDDDETHEVNRGHATGVGGRGRWQFLVAAAPIVSFLGIALMLWLGDSQNGRASINSANLSGHAEIRNHGGVSWRPSQRESRGSRRWWSLF